MKVAGKTGGWEEEEAGKAEGAGTASFYKVGRCGSTAGGQADRGAGAACCMTSPMNFKKWLHKYLQCSREEAGQRKIIAFNNAAVVKNVCAMVGDWATID